MSPDCISIEGIHTQVRPLLWTKPSFDAHLAEDGNFKALTRSEGTRYVRVGCTHTVVPCDPVYRCTCAKCVQVYNLGRDD